ncbi:hypothetical protein NDU88_006222 [Pleurodeles waltl]|uniref:Uncharacterized protein n=1 Tax=Pleurodeles waltl TaxID=8319 RepID=A0AAV7WXM4_PLEWA|nr:hypothetical protein NDU88_006222 [Pleurodeles waltl]
MEASNKRLLRSRGGVRWRGSTAWTKRLDIESGQEAKGGRNKVEKQIDGEEEKKERNEDEKQMTEKRRRRWILSLIPESLLRQSLFRKLDTCESKKKEEKIATSLTENPPRLQTLSNPI